MNPEYYAVSSLETDILISPETLYSQSHINLPTDSIIQLDNTTNMERSPLITLTIHNASNNIILTNQTTSESITISSLIDYSLGTVFTIYNDSVYVNNTEISANFSGLFNLQENTINDIQISTGLNTTFDINVQWICQSDAQIVQGYMQGFSLNCNVTQQKKQVNRLNKYTNGVINQDISYDFSIDTLRYNSYFINQDPDITYHIAYQTDSSVFGIKQQIVHMSGVSINNWGISQGEIELVKEGVKGTVCKIFVV